ncbi:MAG: aminopeptidase [Gammaproteobacteria bacterium]|nr:aminopeptidase [Gammaproteobacteria bacterium]
MGRHGWARRVFIVAAALLQAACHPAYMVQAAAGQLAILRARRPVAEVQADAAAPAALRARLALAGQALAFAHAGLALPDNGSYRQYADLGRQYPVWNVFAAPEFSLDLRTWCFPVAGCAAYRGYFDAARARVFAAGLAAAGEDVFVGPAAAYSTLGYLRDPLLSSVVALPPDAMVGLLFHELAHQQLYVAGDTAFNESFATLVEQEGLVRWLTARGDQAGLCRFLGGLERERAVRALFEVARSRLRTIYAGPGTDEARRSAKAAVIGELRAGYAVLRAGWAGPPYFDGWFAGPINNARLGALAAYDRHVGTLRVILESEGGDWPAFYRRAARLGRLGAADRAEVLGLVGRTSLRAPGPACRAVLSEPAAAGPGSRAGPRGSAGSAGWQPPAVPSPSVPARG